MARTRGLVSNCGMSSIEALMVVAVLSVVVGVVLSLQSYGTRYWRENDVQAELQQSLRSAMATITREIRGARSISDAGAEEITLVRLDGTSVRFYLGEYGDTQALLRSVDGADAEPVGLDIASVDMQYSSDNKLVAIELKTIEKRGMKFSLRSATYLRNP